MADGNTSLLDWPQFDMIVGMHPLVAVLASEQLSRSRANNPARWLGRFLFRWSPMARSRKNQRRDAK